MRWREDEAAHAAILDKALGSYTGWALATEAGRARHGGGLLFQVPERLEPERLIEVETEEVAGITMMRGPADDARRRDGFALTDPGTDLAGALDEANYCIHCHNQGKDSCSHGLKDRKTGAFQKSPFGVTLAGCPLDEKISEFHVLKTRGVPVGALAIDRGRQPALRRHRAPDLQRLHEVVHLSEAGSGRHPAGGDPDAEGRAGPAVRVRDLRPVDPLEPAEPGAAAAASGDRPQGAGGRAGPRRIHLAHHLLNDGHEVVAIDGLKIEPLDPALSGVAPDGGRVPFHPVRDRAELVEPLDARADGRLRRRRGIRHHRAPGTRTS